MLILTQHFHPCRSALTTSAKTNHRHCTRRANSEGQHSSRDERRCVIVPLPSHPSPLGGGRAIYRGGVSSKVRAGIGPRRDASIPLSSALTLRSRRHILSRLRPLPLRTHPRCCRRHRYRFPRCPPGPSRPSCPCGALTPTIYTIPSLRRNVRRLTMIQIPEIHPHRCTLCGQANVCTYVPAWARVYACICAYVWSREARMPGPAVQHGPPSF